MSLVKKKNGATEEFDSKKIEDSLRNTGTTDETAKEVASKVRVKEGITTTDIRRTVSRELKKINAEAAKSYSEARRLVAKKSMEAAEGIAWFSKETMNRLKLKTGEVMDILHGDRVHTMKAGRDKHNSSRNEISLANSDMEALGAEDGHRLVARKRR